MVIRILMVCALLLAAIPAHADEDADRATARALFEEGRELMHAGNYAEACSKLEASRDIVPGVGILFNLAECYDKLGRTASAWSLYRDVAAQLDAIGDKERETAARDRAEALKPTLSTLRIDVPQPLDGMRITRDGREVPANQWGQPLPVDPGSHAIEATAPGRTAWRRDVDVKPNGDNAVVSVPTVETPPSTPAPLKPRAKPVTAAPELAPNRDLQTARTLGWVFTVGGAALTAVGFGLYGAGVGQVAKSERQCNGDRDHCTDADAVALGNDGDSLQRAGLPVGIAGSTVLLAGIITLAVYGPKQADESVTVAISPSSVAVHVPF